MWSVEYKTTDSYGENIDSCRLGFFVKLKFLLAITVLFLKSWEKYYIKSNKCVQSVLKMRYWGGPTTCWGGTQGYWWGGLIPPQLVTVSTENISPSKKVRNLRLLLFYKLKNFNPIQIYSTPWLNSILSSSMTIALFFL